MSNFAANSMHARDIANVLHPQTNASQHAKNGPTIITRGEGIYVYDEERAYIDAVGGLWCASLGFSHERLAKVAYEQMRSLGFYHLFRGRSNEVSINLCERLIQIAPVEMSKVMLQSSGSEANDTAAKFVWYYHAAIGMPRKVKIIGRKMGYHGSTCVAASLSGRPDMHVDFSLPFNHFLHTEFPHYYRYHEEGESEEQFATRMADALEAMILKEGPETIGAFIAEPVMGSGGVVMPPRTYFEKVQTILAKYDILFIADEVICGFGRTGNMWGATTYSLKPDMMTCAKAMAGAMQPISALLINEKIYRAILSESEKLGNLGHGFTYSGHPVAAAVALETLRIYDELNVIDHVKTIGPKLQTALRSLIDHPMVGDVRGVGLMAGIEFIADKRTRKQFDPKLKVGLLVGDCALNRGLVVRVIGDTIGIAPALITSESEIDEIVRRFKLAIDDVWKVIEPK